jgi:hypothetical protein
VKELKSQFLPGPRHDDFGWAFIVTSEGVHQSCGKPRRALSAYCADHHALCHVPCGTIEEKRRLREVEALANAVGGRRSRDDVQPSRRFLRRLEHALRSFS